ncbi:hypothetical protein LSTR_LSTR002105 [Laodelphax striatellus]|uniref:Uncharacterized protein n=1 Tax=Laodelphax striatellus TaxID=195883 RepID=A0A482XRE6_LAOST|nr:hypothetical protein LSTR_LSTR002105 [Laodelphax striatellus]
MLTIHGLRFLAASDRPLYERIFWLVALLAVCFYMFITIAAQIRKYLNNPVLMSMNNEIIPISKIPYPAITFCNTNQIFESFANLTYLLDKDTLTEEESNILDASLTLCSDYKVRYSTMMESKSFNLATNRLLLEVVIHNPAETPTAYHAIASAEKDSRTAIVVTPKLVLTSDDLKSWLPEERGCYYNHERKLRYFKYYTQNNCNTECEINATLEKCNCLQPHHTHLHSTPVCGGFAMKCYVGVLYEALDDFRSSHCKCLPACTELTYEVYSYKTPRNFQYFNLTDRMIPLN